MKKVFTLIAALVLFASAAFAATIDVAATRVQTEFYDEDNDFFIILKNSAYEFRFDIVCAQGSQDIVDGQTYTFDDMLADYSWGQVLATEAYIEYESASLTRVGDSYTATVVGNDGNTYNITYTYTPPITDPTDTVTVDMTSNYSNRAYDLIATAGAIQLIGYSNDGYLMNVVFYTNTFAGSYTLEDRYQDDKYFVLVSNYDPTTGKGTEILCNNLLEATVTGTAANCTAHIKWVADDGTMYDISFDYVEPTPQTQETFTATDLVISQNSNYELYQMFYGVYVYDFQASNGSLILYGNTYSELDDSPYGEWTYDEGYTLDFNLYDAETGMADAAPFNGELTIAKNGTTVSVTGTSLFYGNVQWTFNVTGDASAVEDVEASEYNVYNEGRTIVLNGAEGQNAAIYDIAGRMISNTMVNSDNARFEVAAAGVYVVRVNGQSFRVVVK
ncbi:MAG: T9SS type A sorting domain-containing protein [Paludibacteraceae bacterium]|nr:T9SS type A sorting domain-containing protein [Paludibacteraceae bacterium]